MHDNVFALRVAGAVAPPPEIAQAPSSGISTADWDLLFGAVEARLSAIADDLLDASDGLPARDATAVAQVSMRECVAALQQLHSMLADERQQHERR